MTADVIFNIFTPLSLITAGAVAKWYVWPKLKTMTLYSAVLPLLLVSATRFFGLLFMYPTITADMPAGFAGPAGYGDFAVGVLALIAAFFVRYKVKFGIVLAWLYAILGSADLLMAFALSGMHKAPAHLGAVWPLFLVGGPIYIMTLVLLFVTLIKVKE